MNVPILRLPFTAEDIEFVNGRVAQTIKSGNLVSGPNVEEYERLFAEYSKVKYAVGVANGTCAIEMLLRIANATGGEVLLPTNTFMATAYAVIEAGAKCVFVEADAEDLGMSLADLERKITPQTRAVLVVHIGGVVSRNMPAIQELCRKRGIALVEDGAHAHGCSLNGVQVGEFGIGATFSFFPTKVLTCGEGGMILTNDEKVAKESKILRNHGKNPEMSNFMTHIGNNWRMSEINASLGVANVRKAEAITKERQAIAKAYDEALPGIGGVRPLKPPKGAVSSYYKYICWLDEPSRRAEVKKTMKEKFNVSLTGEVYERPCHVEPLWLDFDEWGHRRAKKLDRNPYDGQFPVADKIAASHICLPLYPGLTPAEVQYVVDSLKKTLNG